MRESLQSWLEERNRFLLESEPSAEIAAFFEDLRAPGRAEDRGCGDACVDPEIARLTS